MKRHFAIIVSTLAFWSTQAFAQNLVQNPGFETGTFAGWTATSAALNPSLPHSGSFSAQLDFNPSSSLSQTIATTPGDSYEVAFWLTLGGAHLPLPFSVGWGGTTIFSINPSDGFAYKEEIIANVTASTSSTILDFTEGNAPGSYDLDDVSVTDVTPAGVPDGGSTLWLLSLVLATLADFTRKRVQA
jgi:hypothetical protein